MAYRKKYLKHTKQTTSLKNCDNKHKLVNIRKGIKHKTETNKSRERKIKQNVQIAKREMPSSDLVLQRTPYIR